MRKESCYKMISKHVGAICCDGFSPREEAFQENPNRCQLFGLIHCQHIFQIYLASDIRIVTKLSGLPRKGEEILQKKVLLFPLLSLSLASTRRGRKHFV